MVCETLYFAVHYALHLRSPLRIFVLNATMNQIAPVWTKTYKITCIIYVIGCE